jgi:hypothetical protein
MNKQSEIAKYIHNEVETHFEFLIERGFHFLESEHVDSPTLIEFTLTAIKVAIVVSFDLREQAVSLYVASIRDGQLTRRGEGGYYGELCSYLRKYNNYRGSISDGIALSMLQTMSIQDRIKRDIRVYAEAIHTHAPRILNDTEDFV